MYYYDNNHISLIKHFDGLGTGYSQLPHICFNTMPGWGEWGVGGRPHPQNLNNMVKCAELVQGKARPTETLDKVVNPLAMGTRCHDWVTSESGKMQTDKLRYESIAV